MSHALKSCGDHSQKNGAHYNIKVEINLERDVQQIQMGLTVGDAHTIGYTVYASYELGKKK